MGSNHKLRCELRGNEGGSIYFSSHGPSHLHFLLFSDEDGVKVYQEWNSWGYYARSFTAVDTNPVAVNLSLVVYTLSRRDGAWTKNFPATHTLNKGQFLITDIYLCDGTWRISPTLPAGEAVRLRVTGHFQNKADKDAAQAGVWTGEVETEPVEISLGKECVERLNSERQQGPAWE